MDATTTARRFTWTLEFTLVADAEVVADGFDPGAELEFENAQTYPDLESVVRSIARYTKAWPHFKLRVSRVRVLKAPSKRSIQRVQVARDRRPDLMPAPAAPQVAPVDETTSIEILGTASAVADRARLIRACDGAELHIDLEGTEVTITAADQVEAEREGKGG